MTSFQKLIGISALIFSLAISYYLVIYSPSKHKEDVENKYRQARQEAATACEKAVNDFVNDVRFDPNTPQGQETQELLIDVSSPEKKEKCINLKLTQWGYSIPQP